MAMFDPNLKELAVKECISVEDMLEVWHTQVKGLRRRDAHQRCHIGIVISARLLCVTKSWQGRPATTVLRHGLEAVERQQ